MHHPSLVCSWNTQFTFRSMLKSFFYILLSCRPNSWFMQNLFPTPVKPCFSHDEWIFKCVLLARFALMCKLRWRKISLQCFLQVFWKPQTGGICAVFQSGVCCCAAAETQPHSVSSSCQPHAKPKRTSRCEFHFPGETVCTAPLCHFVFVCFVWTAQNLLLSASMFSLAGREDTPHYARPPSLFVCICPCILPSTVCHSIITFTQWKSHYILNCHCGGVQGSGWTSLMNA